MNRCTKVFLTALIVPIVGSLAGPAIAAATADNAGFLYGRVSTNNDRVYEGFLRWNDEEAFWDDLFQSYKEERPYLKYADDRSRHARRQGKHGDVRIFGGLIRWESDGDIKSGGRILIARFGDIAAIEVTGSGDATLEMKSGSKIEVSGYANDVGGTIHVLDKDAGAIDLRWDRIDRIEFLPPPSGLDPGVTRLHGTVETSAGSFEGFIQWDKQECLSSDLLDGETDDGDMEIAMGKIRSIDRSTRRSATVELKDGRTLRLSGTNDVNADNRGIMVEDARYGRVVIPWSRFDKVTFTDAKSSGRGYGEYPKSGPLRGEVTDRSGRTYSGRLVLDLDESERWEILNGTQRDIEFNVPLTEVAAIECGRDGSAVELRGGERIELEGAADVTDDNAGVLIFPEGSSKPTFLEWRDVDTIHLAR